MTSREMWDKFTRFFDEARCAGEKSAKQHWVNKIKQALDEWLAVQ